MGRKNNWVLRCIKGEVEGYQLKPLHIWTLQMILYSYQSIFNRLHEVERQCKKVGLKLNAKKTKAMFFHLQTQPITSLEGQEVKQALTEDTKEQDFKYLGNW